MEQEKYSGRVFFPMAQQTPVGQGLLVIEASRSHSDTPHSVGLLWTSDRPDAVIFYLTHNTQKRQIALPPTGFEPGIRNPSKRSAADPRLRPRGHWDF
jgi:hypothetical protein